MGTLQLAQPADKPAYLRDFIGDKCPHELVRDQEHLPLRAAPPQHDTHPPQAEGCEAPKATTGHQTLVFEGLEEYHIAGPPG